MVINVNTKLSSYNIIIKKNQGRNIGKVICDNLGNKLKDTKKVFIITDNKVGKLYLKSVEESIELQGFEIGAYIINSTGDKSNEELKNIDTVMGIYSSLAKFGLRRGDIIISLGGGVVGDISGFVASTYLRGVGYVQIPTTLLSQVDSSIGGKTGIDIDGGKNLVGSFYNPLLVIIDPNYLTTLEERELSSSMAEVIKYALIRKTDLIKKLRELIEVKSKNQISSLIDRLEDIVYTCCMIKKEIVERDQFDTGERMILNFGHTIGHGLESKYDYKKYLHGEAVGIGMYSITEMAIKKGYIKNDEILMIIRELLEGFGLRYELDCDTKDLMKYIVNDKKNIGSKHRIIVVKNIGDTEILEVGTKFFE